MTPIHKAFPLPPLPPLPEYDSKSIYPNEKALSSSQFLLYEKDPQAFWLKYALGARGDSSQAMDIGRIFSAAYADRSLPFAHYLEEAGCKPKFILQFGEALAKFPVLKGGHPELPIWVSFNGWKFRATLDNYLDWDYLVVENKTGKMPWTQERVNFSDQITFQAWTHWKKHKVPPRKIVLNWWNTAVTSYVDIKSFNTSRTVRALKQFEERVEVVVENLEAHNFTRPIY